MFDPFEKHLQAHLQKDSFAKEARVCDTIEDKIKFCEKFLATVGRHAVLDFNPRPDLLHQFPDKQVVQAAVAVPEYDGGYTSSMSPAFISEREVKKQLCQKLMNHIDSSNFVIYDSEKKYESRSILYRAKLGVWK